jgi:hypothetical protein
METELPLPAIRFNALIAELCRVLNAHGRTRFIEQPVLLLIWNRITRMARLFAGLAERVRAGTLAAVAPARSRDAAPGQADAADQPRVRPPGELPRHFRWLVNLVPETEALGGELCWLLQRPEVEELIAEAPQAGRILRPLCRMLGVEPPSGLRLPQRVGVQGPTDPSVTEPAMTEPARPQPADDGCWPQWHGPGLLWPEEARFWRFHSKKWV